jgi:hypothetical protein
MRTHDTNHHRFKAQVHEKRGQKNLQRRKKRKKKEKEKT